MTRKKELTPDEKQEVKTLERLGHVDDVPVIQRDQKEEARRAQKVAEWEVVNGPLPVG